MWELGGLLYLQAQCLFSAGILAQMLAALAPLAPPQNHEQTSLLNLAPPFPTAGLPG